MNRHAFCATVLSAAGGALVPCPALGAGTFAYGGDCAPDLTPPQRADPAQAEIVSVWFSQPSYAWGDLARVVVVASTNTALIEMRVVSYGRALTKLALGRFDGVYRLPFLPPLLDRVRIELPFRFIARNGAGTATDVQTLIAVQG